MNKEINKTKNRKITKKMKNKKITNPPPPTPPPPTPPPPPAIFALSRLSYRYGLSFDNIFLFSYCCSFAYF